MIFIFTNEDTCFLGFYVGFYVDAIILLRVEELSKWYDWYYIEANVLCSIYDPPAISYVYIDPSD